MLSINRRWPSANKVSKASELLPDPDGPQMTVVFPNGISTSIFFKLFCLIPQIWIDFCSLLIDLFFDRDGNHHINYPDLVLKNQSILRCDWLLPWVQYHQYKTD